MNNNIKYTIKDGLITNSNVKVETYSNIEQGEMAEVNAIVLHRTAGSTAQSALNGYKGGQKVGAHFLIDKEGKIYQTASLTKLCWHVGIMYSRGRKESSADPKELKNINAILHESNVSFSNRVKNLSRYEAKKAYPIRYPSNADSVGIEVVGRYNAGTKQFTEPTQKQYNSTKWLVEVLIKEYALGLRKDVYAHGSIARKKEAEGIQLLNYLHKGRTSE
ncbi:N-acetylmuramoyl-L-alanine amidase [Thaumasiovibrio sp. DFM-14]|uniref:peptidoglycan recognition protein family protein n=1 Tax=Thaumasiovibrio sp. DFM-14 TaxID=3384792 RepID=UPI00399F95C3